ncbi:MAG: DUF445 family protein [Aquificae bacterium]|nr:DUF445 family protein [Aquificota bacterium]
MDNLLQLLVFVLIGAFIGYITNYLAIKMLFRPYTEKRIFGVKVPFTPGLIPKQREEIASSIARTVKHHLFSEERIKQLFEKGGYREKVKGGIQTAIGEIVDRIVDDVKNSILDKGGYRLPFVKDGLHSLANLLKDKLKEGLTERLSKKIEESINRGFYEAIKDLPVEEMVKETLMEIDIKQLEEIILGISNKQLKYITYLGAFLGGLIAIFQYILWQLVRS